MSTFFHSGPMVLRGNLRSNEHTEAKKDGVIRSWLNGDKALEVTNLRFRDMPGIKIDKMYFSTFFGGSNASWAPSKQVDADYDNFVIAQNYVGPDMDLADKTMGRASAAPKGEKKRRKRWFLTVTIRLGRPVLGVTDDTISIPGPKTTLWAANKAFSFSFPKERGARFSLRGRRRMFRRMGTFPYGFTRPVAIWNSGSGLS